MKRLFAPVVLLAAAALLAPACGTNKGFDPSRNISFVAREDGSGTKSAFMEIIGLKGEPDPKSAIIQTGTAGVLAEVRGNPAALAYESLGYVTEDAKVLTIDGVEATTANIRDNLYPISRPLSIVYKETALKTPQNKAFFAYLQSDDAQKVIIENGYVSLIDDGAAYEVDASLAGKVSISGSTSLQPLMITLAAAFEKLQPGVDIHVSGGGSGTGYKSAVEGVSAFGMISEEFSPEKAPECVHTLVCKDGIAVIVNKKNPLNDITLLQLRNICAVPASGNAGDAITKWSQLVPEAELAEVKE